MNKTILEEITIFFQEGVINLSINQIKDQIIKNNSIRQTFLEKTLELFKSKTEGYLEAVRKLRREMSELSSKNVELETILRKKMWESK